MQEVSSMKHIFTLSLLYIFCCPAVQASSTIYDGVIDKVTQGEGRKGQRNEEGKMKHETIQVPILHNRSLCSPYSSETVHSLMMTHRDGTFKHNVRTLTDFDSFFVDDVPVELEEMATLVQPGLRMATFENRSRWYFFRLTARNPDSQMGRLERVAQGVAVISRAQHKYDPPRKPVPGDGGSRRVEADGNTYYDDEHFPPMRHEITVPANAEVVTSDWQTHPVEALGNFLNQPVFYQAPRPRQRIELLPENYGAWDAVTGNDTFGGGRRELEYSMLMINLSEQRTQKSLNVRPWHFVPEQGEKVQKQLTLSGYLLAGSHRSAEPGPHTIPLYKGGDYLIDGFYPNRDRDAFWHLVTQRGQHVSGTCRRGRTMVDLLYISSEVPVAWGTITSIDEQTQTVTVQAPLIEGAPISGEQTFQIAGDAGFVRLGLPMTKEDVIKVGSLVKVFAPHPARFFIGKP